MPSLRSFLAELSTEEILRVSQPVPIDFVPTATVVELEKNGPGPVVEFANPSGSDMPVLINLFGDRRRIARMAHASVEDFNTTWIKVLNNPIPPQLVSSGPVQEVVMAGDQVDVTKLPIARHFAQDAGKYINAGVLICRDPDTGVRNLSFQRLQMKDRSRFGANLGSRGHIWEHLNRAAALGRDLDVAVVIGAHPAFYLAAAAKVAMDVDEYDIAGSLLGEPMDVVKCRTIDVEVPAEAEIVLEGRLLSREHADEGPYGEYTGYASNRSTRNIFVVKAISRRARPIYLDIVSGNSFEHLLLGGMCREALVFARLKEALPSVKALYYPKSGTHFHAYLSLRRSVKGTARQALMLLLGLDPYVKLAVAVDDDIDISDEKEVLWALATRFQASTGMFMVPNALCNRVDPSSPDGTASKLALDATVPADWDAARVTLPTSAMEVARQLVGGRRLSVLGSDYYSGSNN